MRLTTRVLVASMLSLSLSASNASGQTTGQDLDLIAKKLDAILKRLETIESRLERLESISAKRWRTDERGLLFDLDGKPMGFWGIDSVIQSPVRR